MASMDLMNQIRRVDIQKEDHMLGKGLQMPFAASNSGSRKLMFGTQLEHRLPLLNPEVPFIQTGYEKEFGRYSSSYITAQEDMTVVGIVPKFSWNPQHHYYIFAIGNNSKTLYTFERKTYKHITENYGYLFNNNVMDAMAVGQTIAKEQVIQSSTSFDEYGNRMDGCNLLTLYTACEETMEDAIVISETAAKKLASPLVKKVNIVINDNDIPLNLYGTADFYKAFPDIGEDSIHSTLCALRREKKEECLFSQSYSRLRELTISDEKYTVSGRVVDINVYCNSPDKLGEYEYNSQLKKYYDENLRFSQQVIDVLQPYLDQGYNPEYELQRLISISRGALEGKQYFSERVFSNIVLEVTLIEEIPVLRGDKLSNRYGGKGITSRIKPDKLMPKTKDGQTVEVILNMCGVYGRENAGQLFEITVSYICIKLLQFIQTQTLDVGECINLYLTLLKIVAPSMVPYMEEMFARMDEDECISYIGNILSSEKSIYLVIEPMTENMTIDKVAELYKEFSWINQEKMMMPITNSMGEVNYVPSRRPMVYGYQYIYRLKQYAEEKFSVTSLSATNIRNENSKSKSSNNYKALYSRTPIRFGDMETGNLIHLGAELVVQMLMLYSTSPNARRITAEMLTGDPFNIDVKLDDNSTNRNVEILNVYLKTMGLKITFKKIPKEIKHPILIQPMEFSDPKEHYGSPIIFQHPDENFSIEAEVERLMSGDPHHPVEIVPINFLSDLEPFGP